jgi:hypothetical protein
MAGEYSGYAGPFAGCLAKGDWRMHYFFGPDI